MQSPIRNFITNPFLLSLIAENPLGQPSETLSQQDGVVAPAQMKTPPELKVWYHPVGLLARQCWVGGLLDRETLRQRIEVDSQTCNMILPWLKAEHPSFNSISFKDLLGLIYRHTSLQPLPGSLWLLGGAVDDWLKRILPWAEIFDRLGVSDTAMRTLLIKQMNESVDPDSSQITLQVRRTVHPLQNSQEVLQEWASRVQVDLKKFVLLPSREDELQPDLSKIQQEVISYALRGMGCFPRQMTPVEVPVQLELVTEREKFSHPSCLSIAIDLQQEPIGLTVPAELVWKTALGDWSRHGVPRNEQEFLSLVEGYTLLEQRCLTPHMRDIWVNWFCGYACEESADPMPRISRWITDFRMRRYEKRPWAEVTLRYQVSLMLLGHIPEKELSRLWSCSKSLTKLPDSLHKIMLQALAKDQMLLSSFDSLLQIVAAVVVGFTEPNADSSIRLDYSDGKDYFRIRCGEEGSVLVAAHLSEAMGRISRDLMEAPKETEKVLADILRSLAPHWGAGVNEALAYLRTLGLEPEGTVALAEQCLASQEPLVCHFGYLLHELFIWQNPSAGRGMNLFIRLPIALKGLQGEARVSLLQRLGKFVQNTPYEYLKETLQNMPSSDWEVQSYWIRALMRTSRNDCKQAAITLWKKIDDPKGQIGLRMMPFTDFLSSLEILFEIETRLNPSDFQNIVGMVLNKRPRKAELQEKLALSNLLAKYRERVFPFIQQWSSIEFLELLESITEAKLRFHYLLEYEIAQEGKKDGSSLGNIWPATLQATLKDVGQAAIWGFLLKAQARNLKLERLFPKADHETVTQSLDQVIPQEYSPIAAALLVSVSKNFDSKEIYDFCTLRLGNYLEDLLKAVPAPGNQILQEAFDQCCSYLPIVRQRDLLRRLAELSLQRKCAVLATKQLLMLLKVSPTEPSAEETDLAIRVIRFQIKVDVEPARSLLYHNRLKDRLPIELWWETCEAESLSQQPRQNLLVELLRQLHASQVDHLRLALAIVNIVDILADHWPLPAEALQPLVTALREEKDSSRLFRLLEALMPHKQAIDVDTKDVEWAILQAAEGSELDGARLARLAKYCQTTDAAVATAITRRFLQQAMPIQAEEWLGLCPPGVQTELSLQISALFFEQRAHENCYRLLSKLPSEVTKTKMQQILDAADAEEHPHLIMQILIQNGDWVISANCLSQCIEGLVKNKVSGISAEGLIRFLMKYQVASLNLWKKIWGGLDKKLKAPVIEDLFQIFLQNEARGWDKESESARASCWQLAIHALSRVNSRLLFALLKANYFERFGFLLDTPTEATDNAIKKLFEGSLLYATQQKDTEQITQIAEHLSYVQLTWNSPCPHHKQTKMLLSLVVATVIYRFEIKNRFLTTLFQIEQVFRWLNMLSKMDRSIPEEARRGLFTLIETLLARKISEDARSDALKISQLARKHLDPRCHFRYFFGFISVILPFRDPEVVELAGELLKLCLPNCNQFPEISHAVCERLKSCEKKSTQVQLYRDIIHDKFALGFMSKNQLKAARWHVLEDCVTTFAHAENIPALRGILHDIIQCPEVISYLIQNISQPFIIGICFLCDYSATENASGITEGEERFLSELQLFFKVVQKIDPHQVSLFQPAKINSARELADTVAVILLKFPWRNALLRRVIHIFIGSWLSCSISQPNLKLLTAKSDALTSTLLARTWVLLGIAEGSPQSQLEKKSATLVVEMAKYFEIVRSHNVKCVENEAAALCVGVRDVSINSAILLQALDYLLASPSNNSVNRAFELLDKTLESIQKGESHQIFLDPMKYLMKFCNAYPLTSYKDKSLAGGIFEFLVRYRTLLEQISNKEQGLTLLQIFTEDLLQGMLDRASVSCLKVNTFLADFCDILDCSQGCNGLVIPISLSPEELASSMMRAIPEVNAESVKENLIRLGTIIKRANGEDQG